jgi:hypothetical protein
MGWSQQLWEWKEIFHLRYLLDLERHVLLIQIRFPTETAPLEGSTEVGSE